MTIRADGYTHLLYCHLPNHTHMPYYCIIAVGLLLTFYHVYQYLYTIYIRICYVT